MVGKPARTAPVGGFSVRKRVIRLQIIEKSVESSRSSPETGAGEGIESPLRLQHSALCKRITRSRTEKPPTGAVWADFPTVVARVDRV